MPQKLDILNHSYKIKKEEDMTGVIIEDSHDVLISIVSHYFICCPTKYQAAIKSILVNLHCPSLTNYRQYKDIFLTNVFKR